MIALLFVATLPAQAEDTCTLRIEGHTKSEGVLYFGVYLPEHAPHFPGGEAGQVLRDGTAPIEDGKAVVVLEGLPAGTYAVSAFVDVDGNGALDTNFLGIPKEPWAVSNNVRNAMSAPRFDQAKFTVAPGATHAVPLEMD